jgi:prepilin-type processing-associated H-X9-DG protein
MAPYWGVIKKEYFTNLPNTQNGVRYTHLKRANFLFTDLHVTRYSYSQIQTHLTGDTIKLANVGLAALEF